jgi:hypothetical protein
LNPIFNSSQLEALELPAVSLAEAASQNSEIQFLDQVQSKEKSKYGLSINGKYVSVI